MPKFRVYGKIVGSKYLGEIEAETEEEAVEKAYGLDSCYCSLCHHCSDEIDDPEVDEIQVEAI